MKRSLLATAAVVGLWPVAAPFVLSWGLSLEILAASVVPGALTVQLGILACTLRPSATAGDIDYRLMCRTCSFFVLLGAWLLLGPLLAGYPLGRAETYLGALLPGVALMGLGLVNGYLGWKEANPS